MKIYRTKLILIKILHLQNASTLPNYICFPCKDRLREAFNFKTKLNEALNAEQWTQNAEIPGDNGAIRMEDDEGMQPFECEICERCFEVKEENYQTHVKRHEMTTKDIDEDNVDIIS